MARSFTWFEKFGEVMEALPAENQAEFALAIVRYGSLGEEPEFDSPLMAALFTAIREDVDNSLTKRASASKGGRPPKAGKQQAETNGGGNAETGSAKPETKPETNEKPNPETGSEVSETSAKPVSETGFEKPKTQSNTVQANTVQANTSQTRENQAKPRGRALSGGRPGGQRLRGVRRRMHRRVQRRNRLGLPLGRRREAGARPSPHVRRRAHRGRRQGRRAPQARRVALLEAHGAAHPAGDAVRREVRELSEREGGRPCRRWRLCFRVLSFPQPR